MPPHDTLLSKLKVHAHKTHIGRLFWDKSFVHYLWTGGLFTFLNIFLVWLCIDIFHVPTLIATSGVILSLFLARYVLYRILEIM